MRTILVISVQRSVRPRWVNTPRVSQQVSRELAFRPAAAPLSVAVPTVPTAAPAWTCVPGEDRGAGPHGARNLHVPSSLLPANFIAAAASREQCRELSHASLPDLPADTVYVCVCMRAYVCVCVCACDT